MLLDLNNIVELEDMTIGGGGDEDEITTTMMAMKVPEGYGRGGGQVVDDSGTSNSYVVNAEAASSNGGCEEDSFSTHTIKHDNNNNNDLLVAFNFDILTKGDVSRSGKITASVEEEAELVAGNLSLFQSSFVTKQLFPVNGGDAGGGFNLLLPSSDSSSSKSHWVVDLTSSDYGGGSGGGDGGWKPEEVKLVQQKPQQQQQQQQQPQQQQQQQVKKSRRGPRSRSSQYRGVTFYRRTGRWESHIWDCGKQVYLGGFDTAHSAARAYDRAAIKFRGVEADINFNLSDYDEDMKQMTNLTKEEFVHILRRHSTGFSRGTSKYRGVTLHKCGRWEARMGQFLGKKAYDKAAIKCNGREAVTNFEPSTYAAEIMPKIENGGTNDYLDLNLGISTPLADGRHGSDTVSSLHFSYAPFDMHDAKRARTDNPPVTTTWRTQPINGGVMASEPRPFYGGVPPSFFPSFEKRAMAKFEVGGPGNQSVQIEGSHVPT